MIPLRDHNPTYRRAVIVPALLAINVFVFLFVQPTFADQRTQQGAIEVEAFFACRAAIPYEVTHGETLQEAVPDDPIAFSRRAEFDALLQQERCPRKSVWISILTSMFLHGGWLHIGGNMLFLWVFGNNVEDRLGRIPFVLFYLLAGLAATYAQSYIVDASSTTPLIGASGAIAGILGAYLLMFPHARVTTLVVFFFITAIELPAIVVLGLWFVLQFFQGVAAETSGGGVAYFAHIGGFVAGMLLLLLFRPVVRRRTG